jgi:hypothetical protein
VDDLIDAEIMRAVAAASELLSYVSRLVDRPSDPTLRIVDLTVAPYAACGR